jgi:hypothetical protein
MNEEFWPFTIRHTCFHNAPVRSDPGKSLHHLFTGNMEDFRVFGPPVFMLDKKLQDGDSLAKWKAHSWLGVYIRHSRVHSGNVPVLYTIHGQLISPRSSTLCLVINFQPSLAVLFSSPTNFSNDYIIIPLGSIKILTQKQMTSIFLKRVG